MKVVGWNGRLVSSEQAAVPVMDHGFLYGMTLFETMRTYGGRPFLLERHLRRLAEACGTLGIRYTLDAAQAERHIGEVMAANGLKEAYIRYTVSAGENGFGLPAGTYTAPLTLVLTKPLPLMPDMMYVNGKPLQLLQTRRNSPEAAIRYKSGHYMNNIVAKRELTSCRSAGQGMEGLMLTADGKLAEGIVSNLFFIAGDRLCTPAIEAGILPGITRGFVLELAPACGLHPEEGLYTWDDLMQAEEVFITTSVQELVPITSLWGTDGEPVQVGLGRIGSFTAKLLQLYRAAAAAAQ
ncbi:aminotransferase class IV [Paenibacillus apiarius]|uniref:aminotransferase class IV n=1 Tax=Paenibacillus apiarius TaxID=46240 RepID=UPI003B3BADC6